jgi:hypothetical protein
VAEIIESWLDRPYSHNAIAADDEIVDEFDGEDEEMFVRKYVTATTILEALARNPVLQEVKMSKSKVIGQAMRSIEGWEYLGKVRRLGRQARWYVRKDMDGGYEDMEEFAPASTIRGAAQASDGLDEESLGMLE